MEESIYGKKKTGLQAALELLAEKIENGLKAEEERRGHALYDHLLFRLKSEESMREKCDRKHLPQTEESALLSIHDALGIRIVCPFVADVYETVSFLRSLPGSCIMEEKDYIQQAKANGYRSYHLILQVSLQEEERTCQMPAEFYCEIQLRTIAMDTWAALEHEIKYKRNVKNPELMTKELKRCADELAACDISMQALRDMGQGE